MESLYMDELNDIKRKTRQVFNRSGIYPFLDDGNLREELDDEIPGFQIFSLWGDDYGVKDEE